PDVRLGRTGSGSTAAESMNAIVFWRTAADAVYRTGEHKTGTFANHDVRDGGRIPLFVRESAGVHAAIHEATSRDRSPLLLPAERAGWWTAARPHIRDSQAPPGWRNHI